MLETMFLGVRFPRGYYVGDKSSESHWEAISRGILSEGNFPGAIIQGAIIRGSIFLCVNCPGSSFSRGQLTGGQSSRGQMSGDNCQDTLKNKNNKSACVNVFSELLLTGKFPHYFRINAT